MRRLAGILLLGAAAAMQAPDGQSQPASFCASCGVWNSDTFVSHSKQFVVHGNALPKPRRYAGLTNAPALMNLEPQILAVTAERTKRAFLQELLAPDQFHDKIHAVVVDQWPAERPIGIVSSVYTDGFQYTLAFPGQVEHTKMVRALVQALLLEYSNRGARRCAELPRWLVEGMTHQVLASTVPTYVLNESHSEVDVLGYDRLSYTRAYLSTNTPLTIQELSFYEGGDEGRFSASAHMLVHELLALKGGPALLRRFIQSLPHCLNWQTAFYQVYNAHFSTPLAFEKWWMLAWSDERSRPGQEIWSVETSLSRLSALLLTSMEARLSTNSIPQRRELPLQEVIVNTEFNVQRAIFSRKIQELYFVSVNLAPEVRPLAHAYQEVLDAYIQKRAQTQPGLKYDPEQRAQVAVQSVLKQLDYLESARKDVKEGRPFDYQSLQNRKLLQARQTGAN